MRNAAPRLSARYVPGAPGICGRLVVRCDWCEDEHTHGAAPGHRVAHCACSDSPYRATGYELDQPRAEVPAGAAPEALYLGQRRLRDDLARIAPRFRSTFLATLLGARVGHHFDKRVGRARIGVFGVTWIIDPDAYPSRAELQAPRVAQRAARMGRDCVTLLAALYGMAPGIVGVRLFEAITGMAFDAEARLRISEEIEAMRVRVGAADGVRP